MNSSKIRHTFHIVVILVLNAPAFYLPMTIGPNPGMQAVFPSLLVNTLTVVPFYLLNVYYLVPAYLSNRKYLKYTVIILSCLLVFSILMALWHYYFREPVMTIRFKGDMPPGAGMPPRDFTILRLPPILPFLMTIGLGTSFEMVLNWENQQKKIMESDRERMDTELRFLRTQINPHFFFNTLNSIYSLAIEKSDDTQKAILILSNLMRYILYESNTERVKLEREVDFLNDYISLQKMRMADELVPEIRFDVRIEDPGVLISPILLIPIVENAFKHSKSYTGKPQITIRLVAREGLLIFHVSNSIGELTDSQDEFSGIGLKNIQRRLDLIYPGHHHLTAQKSGKYFVVDLSIKFQEKS